MVVQSVTNNMVKLSVSQSNKNIMQDFREKPLPYIVQAVGLLVVILNLWNSVKLFAFKQGLARGVSYVYS